MTHFTELLVIPRTTGMSPFGDPTSRAKEKEVAGLSSHHSHHSHHSISDGRVMRHALHGHLHAALRTTDAEETEDIDKDRPCVWDVRRHHAPKYVLLGGEGAIASWFPFVPRGSSDKISSHSLTL
jgi:hypothetical protein